MPLMKPLPGDLADRQTILELKINHCNAEFDEEPANMLKAGKMGMARTVVNKGAVNVAPFLDELDLVRKELSAKWVQDLIAHNKVEDYDKLYTQLEEANAQLWNLEDQIRALKAAPKTITDPIQVRNQSWYDRVVEVAFAITDTNDKRSDLIKKINALWNYQTQEKMY